MRLTTKLRDSVFLGPRTRDPGPRTTRWHYNDGMSRPARVVTWNGKDVPPELRELPAGRYLVAPVEDESPALSPEEEAGIEAALDSYRQGRVVDARRAREIIDAALAR